MTFLLISRARALALLAKGLNIPVVLTTSQEEIQQEFAARVRRQGITNAWDDADFRAAVLKAVDGRKNIIMAGLTNDVCIVWPAIDMQEEGFNVQVVIDGDGSPTQIAEDVARSTWEANGVRTTAISQFFSELISSLASPKGEIAKPIVIDEIYSLLFK